MRSVEKFKARLKQGITSALPDISITNGCNLRCQGCWSTSTSPPS